MNPVGTFTIVSGLGTNFGQRTISTKEDLDNYLNEVKAKLFINEAREFVIEIKERDNCNCSNKRTLQKDEKQLVIQLYSTSALDNIMTNNKFMANPPKGYIDINYHQNPVRVTLDLLWGLIHNSRFQ